MLYTQLESEIHLRFFVEKTYMFYLLVSNLAYDIFLFPGKCHFLPGGGGAPENWGDQVLCLSSKGGIKRFFQIKKGGSLIFFKEIKYFVKHSWNSCQFYRKGGLLILTIVGTLQNEVKSCNLGRVWIPYHQRTQSTTTPDIREI